MAIAGMITRRLGWLLFVGALVLVLSGCTQRQENNPFLGPTGGGRFQPFGGGWRSPPCSWWQLRLAMTGNDWQ